MRSANLNLPATKKAQGSRVPRSIYLHPKISEADPLPLSADSDSSSLISKNGFLFYEESKISSCCLVFKLIYGTLPNYLNKDFTVNNQVHTRNTRYVLNVFYFLLYQRQYFLFPSELI